MGLPCFSSGSVDPRRFDQAPVESRTTPRRMRSLRRAAARQAPRSLNTRRRSPSAMPQHAPRDDRDRLAALDLGGAGMRAVVELAVQLVGRLLPTASRPDSARRSSIPAIRSAPAMSRARGNRRSRMRRSSRRRSRSCPMTLPGPLCAAGSARKSAHVTGARFFALGLGDAGLPEFVERRDGGTPGFSDFTRDSS